MPKIIISGSAKLQNEIKKWSRHFLEKGYEILDYPKPIDTDDFYREYPSIHISFYENIKNCDIFFLMNETKNNIKGYIGPAGISELSFAIMENLLHNKNIKIYVLNLPDSQLSCSEEINCWLNLGWINLYSSNL